MILKACIDRFYDPERDNTQCEDPSQLRRCWFFLLSVIVRVTERALPPVGLKVVRSVMRIAPRRGA